MRLVILISGSGSTMESIIKATYANTLSGITVAGVISSDKSAKGIEKARRLGIDCVVIDRKEYGSGQVFGEKILKQCRGWGAQCISQNGWMPHTPLNVVREFEGMIINQHPGPLDPEHRNGERENDFGGVGMYGIVPSASVYYFRKQILENIHPWYARRIIYTEATVHYVTEMFDQGAVIKRTRMDILENDCPESIQKRLLPIEHKTVIEALSDLVNGKVTIQKRPRPFVRKGEHKYLIKAKELAIKNYLKVH